MDAQFALGVGYEVGTILPQDLIFAVYWYRKAADGGHALAGEYLDRYPEQVALFGDAERLFLAGLTYMPRFNELQRQSDPYLESTTIRGSDGSAEAAALWREAAEMGHVEAHFLLAQHYLSDNRNSEAMAWFRKAADKGHAGAQFLVASIADDLKEKTAWLQKAAAQGHAKAQCSLGMAYWLGQGVPRDRVQSYAWMNVGSRGGTTPADECHDLLDDAEEILTSEEVAEAQTLSRELFRRMERQAEKHITP